MGPAAGDAVVGLAEALTQWDGAWYARLATHGYEADPPSAVFFPAYPELMRLVAPVTGSVVGAGVALTLTGAAAAVVSFRRWALIWFGREDAMAWLLVLLLYPFSFYLAGVVYTEAMFLALTIGAFLLLERDRPVAAAVPNWLIWSLQAVVPVVVLIAVPFVWRRFGAGYAVYILLAVMLPLVVRPTIIGSGRYLLTAFPIFGLVGPWVRRRGRAGWALVAFGAGIGLLFASLFSRGVWIG